LGETGWGLYVAYGLIGIFLLLVVGLSVRTVLMISLLLLAPVAGVLRLVPWLRRFVSGERTDG
jgi:hypothetical protein